MASRTSCARWHKGTNPGPESCWAKNKCWATRGHTRTAPRVPLCPGLPAPSLLELLQVHEADVHDEEEVLGQWARGRREHSEDLALQVYAGDHDEASHAGL